MNIQHKSILGTCLSMVGLGVFLILNIFNFEILPAHRDVAVAFDNIRIMPPDLEGELGKNLIMNRLNLDQVFKNENSDVVIDEPVEKPEDPTCGCMPRPNWRPSKKYNEKDQVQHGLFTHSDSVLMRSTR
jgi:hypothetical protein